MPRGRAPASHLDLRAPSAASFFTRAESKTGIDPGFNLEWMRVSFVFHQMTTRYALGEVDDLETFLTDHDELVAEEMYVEGLGGYEKVLHRSKVRSRFRCIALSC